ncbi:MAG: thioesterase family protein [Alphaproteobacteria bacterium]
MSGWTETYRGVVNAWECDVTEHLTVAYYFERFSDATILAMEAAGIGPTYMAETGRSVATVSCDVRYQSEFRAGGVLHIESAVLGVGDKTVRFGHRVIDSSTGAVATTLDQTCVHFDMAARKSLPFDDAQRQALAARVATWDVPDPEPHEDPAGDDGFVDSALDTAKPWEIDVNGHVGFQFYVHRFSAAMAQALNAMGLSSAYMHEHRRGFSTFEFQLKFFKELHAGDAIAVRSAIMHLGGSSVRMLHRMRNARTDEPVAQLSQFGVNLDLDARRPARLPDDVRAKAKALLVG